MPRAEYVQNNDGEVCGVAVHCPACGHGHYFNTTQPGKPRWTFNGDLDRPTFTPSMLVFVPSQDGQRKTLCHSFVRDGQIQYLNDCAHDMKGQTVDLPEVD